MLYVAQRIPFESLIFNSESSESCGSYTYLELR